MKVLHVVPWLARRYGGPATLVPQACLALIDAGHTSEIVTTNVDGHALLDVSLDTEETWFGARVRFHSVSSPRRFLTSWSMLGDLLRRTWSFDLVHIHCLYRFHGLAAAFAARRANVPYVIQTHGALDPWNRTRSRHAKDLYHFFVEDRLIDHAAGIVCTSIREEEAIRQLGYTMPTFVIPNGVQIDDLRAAATSWDALGGTLPPEANLVTFLGRVSKMKGIDLLVDAFAQVATEFTDAHLVIAGPDDEGLRPELKAQLDWANIGSRASFVGLVNDREKAALLRRSSVVVLPSPGESFGLAAAEAMALGSPVVVSPSVGIAETIVASGAGRVAPRTPAKFAAAIGAILADPEGAKTMGAAGESVAESLYAWPKVGAQLAAMYRSVLAAQTRRRAASLLAESGPRSGAANDPLSSIRCPVCRGPLAATGEDWACAHCTVSYNRVSNIPVLLADSSLAEHDELHHHAHDHKAAQAAHFDSADEEAFEVARPHGTPRLYRFLLGEKFRRATESIRPQLAAGASALVVCGGSGMDAEYLARGGGSVITSDISIGATRRARTRSERYGLGIQPLVADVEMLPFADRTIDLVAVHDGLHHLADPYRGLDEMARVAKRWVIVTEPARAAVTRLAVRLGLALEREDAGNPVARLDPRAVAGRLSAHGFLIVKADRYAMYYPHRPGRGFALMSAGPVYPLVRWGWRIANALAGRWGNKMVVVAERLTEAPAAPDA